MELLTLSARKQVCNTIRTSIVQNSRIHTLFGSKLKGLRFHFFIRQCARFLRRKNGALLASQDQGVALIVPIVSEKDQQPPIRWWQSLFLFPFGKIGSATRFKRRVKELMPTEPHLLFMLLMAEEQRNGISHVIGVRDELFKLSEIMQLPVYAQTSCEGTKVLFEGFGFITYGQISIPGKEERMYFLKKPPGN